MKYQSWSNTRCAGEPAGSNMKPIINRTSLCSCPGLELAGPITQFVQVKSTDETELLCTRAHTHTHAPPSTPPTPTWRCSSINRHQQHHPECLRASTPFFLIYDSSLGEHLILKDQAQIRMLVLPLLAISSLPSFLHQAGLAMRPMC